MDREYIGSLYIINLRLFLSEQFSFLHLSVDSIIFLGLETGSVKRERKWNQTGEGGKQNTGLKRQTGWKKRLWRGYYKLTREPEWLFVSYVQLPLEPGDHKYLVE